MIFISPKSICLRQLVKWKPEIIRRASSSTGLITNVKGQRINYVKVGSGPRNVLCLPGALGTMWSDFKPQLEGLDKNKFTIVSWDPPGYGLSRPPNRSFHIKIYEDDADIAHDFMQNIGINQFSLLGWSDGGFASMILAAKYPESVEKLVVWGTSAYMTSKDIESFETIRDTSKWSDKIRTPSVQLYTEEGMQKIWSDWCDNKAEFVNKYDGDICKTRLKDIQCPTLILHGDKDFRVPLESSQYLLDNIKNAKLHRYPDGKHNIHLRYSNDFNKIVSDFILSTSK